MGTAGLKAVSGAFDRVPTPLPPFIRVAAGVAISGVFDLAPLQQSPHVNDKLQLTQVWGGRRGRAGCRGDWGGGGTKRQGRVCGLVKQGTGRGGSIYARHTMMYDGFIYPAGRFGSEEEG